MTCTERIAFLSKCSRAAGVTAVLAGLWIVAGWMLKNTAAGGVFGELQAAETSAGLVFILAGLSLCLQKESEGGTTRGRLGQTCAWLVVGVAVLACGVRFGFERSVLPWLSWAPGTIVGFALTGLALVLLDFETRAGSRPSQYLALLAVLSSFLALFEYAYGTPAFDSVLLTQVGGYAALAFPALAAGVLIARSGRGFTATVLSDDLGGVVARRLLPAAIGLPVVLSWLRWQGELLGIYGTASGVALAATIHLVIFTVLVWWCARSLSLADAERRGAKATLEGERNLLRTLIDHLPAYVFVKDKESRFLLNNAAHRKELGVASQSDMLGKTDFDFFTPEHAAKFRADEEQVIASREPLLNLEESFEDKNGNTRWVLMTKAPLIGPSGEVTGVVGVGRDITERKQEQDALARLAAIVASTSDAIISITLDGMIVSWNTAAERMYGYSSDEVTGRHFSLLAPAGAESEMERLLDRIKRQETIAGYETIRVRKDGTPFHVSLTVSPIMNAEGKVTGASAIARDINKRKEAEQELRESKERLQAILDHATSVIYLKDLTGRYILANRQHAQLFDISNQEIVGKTDYEVFAKGLADNYRANDRKVAEVGEPLEFEEASADHRGLRSYFSVKFPVRNAAGEIYAIGGISTDVTQRQQAEGEVRRMNAALSQANAALEIKNREVEHATQMKSHFLASMSHELRTPLTAIVGFSDLLAQESAGPLSEKQKRFVKHVQSGASHLLQLINDILDLSKIEAGKMEMHPENFVVKDAIPEVLSVIHPLAAKKKIRVSNNVPDGVMIHADRVRFKQILYNLLSNAVKFTPHEGEIRIESTAAENGFVRLLVTDTGVGIRPEDHEIIFDVFQQVGETTRGVKEGTGLGLAITRQLVEGQSGKIWLESQVGKGSRFSFTLPAASTIQEELLRLSAQVANPPVREKPLVLIVDDEAACCELLAGYLEPEGYETIAANSADEALSRARELLPDAITLDILGLGKNGWEVLQELKSDPRTAGIPGVIVSVVDEPNLGIALHAADYVIKPVTKPRVLAALRRHAPPQGQKSRTVLVVDDDVRHLEMAAEMLRSAGYSVLQSPGGREALDTLRTTRPDAIVLDLMMPEIDGFQLLDRIRQQPALSKIPVLVLTAKDLTDSDVERLFSRVEALCRKGLSRDELLSHIERLTGAAAVENAAVVEHVQNRRS